MKIVHFILALLFLVFAAVQLNDSDPYLWVAIYTAMAVAFALKLFQRSYVILTYVLALFCGFYLIYLLPDFIDLLQTGMPSITSTMQAETPHVELVREFLGLFICVMALTYLIKTK